MRFTGIATSERGFSGLDGADAFAANFDLFLIREAWDDGVSFEDLADGFGPGFGTRGDWSAIRDSSRVKIDMMFQRALNHFFGT